MFVQKWAGAGHDSREALCMLRAMEGCSMRKLLRRKLLGFLHFSVDEHVAQRGVERLLRKAGSLPLVIAGEHNIPRLLQLPGRGHCVAGEIYKVDDKMLRFLDDFEGCPAMYQRTAVQVRVLEWEGGAGPGDSVQCFVYSTATYAPEWVHLPYHDSYDSEGSHGLRYNPRENR